MDPRQPGEGANRAPAPPEPGTETWRGASRSSAAFRILAAVLALAALVAYGTTLSRTAFPGLPTQALLEALGWRSLPETHALLWGILVRGCARWLGSPVAAWMGGFAALCGAAGVYLAARLASRMGYRRWLAWTKSSQDKERQARLLSGAVAGLYLAGSTPFWVAATRSLPATFHLLLLLLVADLFARYQRRGGWARLGLLGFLYGLGMVEFATFIVFAPAALALLGVELYRWRVLGSRKAHAILWGGVCAGGLGYPLHALLMFWRGGFDSPLEALVRILQAQVESIVVLRNHPGFLVILFFCVAPWLLLFALSRRSPWFYEVPQVLVRLAFIGGLLAILFNASFAPWRMLGMQYLMVTPYLLFATCTGYMAGEFWILGEPPPPRSSRARRLLRRASGAFAALLPVVVAAAAVVNGREADGRQAAFVRRAVDEVLGRLDGRDTLFTAGALDDSLRLAIGERGLPLRMIRVAKTDSPLYLQYLAGLFTDDRLRRPLQEGDFARFQKNWMARAGSLAGTATLDMPDMFRAAAQPVPDGLVYRLEPAAAPVDGAALLAAQAPLWRWAEAMAARPLPARSLVYPHQDWLLAVVAKTANNLGVFLVERGDEARARAAFHAARRIRPGNLSALMNLRMLDGDSASPEAAELEAEWLERSERARADHWLLSSQHGYLWRVPAWVARGVSWALSGLPSNAGLAPEALAAPSGETDLFRQWLDRAYLEWGAPPKDEWSFRLRLGRNARDAEALLELARLALRRPDFATAEVYLAEALAAGLPAGEVRFDRALLAAARGEKAAAVAQLQELGRQTPGDLRVWSALLQLAEEADPAWSQALRELNRQPTDAPGVHLVLAWEHLRKHRWAEAEAELDQVVQRNPRHRLAWELLVVLGQLEGNRRLLETGTRTLVAEDPEHPLARIRRALVAKSRGQLDAAEAELRAGLRAERNPDLLNVLADVRLAQGAADGDIRPLLEEAIAKRPFHPAYRCTRIELELREGHLDAAWREIQLVRKAMPRFAPAYPLAARVLAAHGRRAEVRQLAEKMGGWPAVPPPRGADAETVRREDAP